MAEETVGNAILEGTSKVLGKVLGVVSVFLSPTEAHCPEPNGFQLVKPKPEKGYAPSDNTKVGVDYPRENPEKPVKNDDDNIKKFFVYEDITPEIYAHTVKAIGNGHPEILTYKGLGQSHSNRRKALKNTVTPEKEYQRDEYPYASTLEGGRNASIMIVRAKENQIQGGQLSVFYSQLKPGEKFIVVPVPKEK